MSLIFLTGMPGSGKSSLARLWARSYNWHIVDMDIEIIRAHGPIPHIFAERGEDFFRNAEQDVLHRIIKEHRPKTIVATGGGTPCFFDNQERMKASGCVLYIEAPAEVLLKRLGETSNVRPLLAGADREVKLRKLLAAREAVYRQAHFTYHSESLSEATFAEIIDTCTNRHL
jgi:shikimate kinase